MKRLLITLLLTGCAGAPAPVSDFPPEVGGRDYISYDPSVPTRWVQDHQDQFGFGGVRSVEHVSMMQGEVVSAGVIGDIYVRHYTVHTRDRGALEIMTDVPNYGATERVTAVFTGSAVTDDLVYICGGGGSDPC